MSKETRGPAGLGSPVEERRAVQSVLDRYGLAFKGMGPRRGALLTDGGPVRLCRFPGTWEELCFVAAAVEYVEQRGFTRLRRLRRTSTGEPGVRVGTGLFYLAEGEPGRNLGLSRRGDLQRVATLLADFHRAAEGLPPTGHAERERLRSWPGVLQERQADLLAMRREAAHAHGEFARLYAEFADDFLEQGERAVGGLLASPLAEVIEDCAVRRRLAHRRFTPSRVRRVGQDLVLDGWAHLGLDLPAVDLARFLQRAAHRNPDRAYAFLEAYDEALPLSEPEWEVLLAWLRFPHEFWRLGHLHFRQRETHRSRLARVIRDEVEREVFVERLALEWAARKLAPAPAPGLADEPCPAKEDDSTESSKHEREASPVTEREELIALGVLEGAEEAGAEAASPAAENPAEGEAAEWDASPPEKGELSWAEGELPVEELPMETVALEPAEDLPGVELTAWEPVLPPEDAPAVEVPPAEVAPWEPAPPEEEPVPLEEVAVVEPPAALPAADQPRVIVWRAFPPPLAPKT